MKVKTAVTHELLSRFLFLEIISFIFIRATPMNQPTFNSNDGHVTAVAGQDVVLPCSINHLGKFKVVWIDPRGLTLTFDNKRVIDDQRFGIVRPFIKDWNLLINNVMPPEAGTYLCTINTPEILFQSVQLTIKVSPQIHVNESSVENMEAVEGDDVTLRCVASGSPGPTIHWYKRIYAGKVLSFHYERMDSSKESLIIRNISRHGENPFHVFECVASNGIPPDARLQIKISVHYSPAVVVPTDRLVKRRNQQVVLECVVQSNPMETYYLEHHSIRVHSSERRRLEDASSSRSDVRILRLIIPSLGTKDFGHYKCIAINNLGRSEASIFLSEHHSLDQHLASSKKYIPSETSTPPLIRTNRSLDTGERLREVQNSNNTPRDSSAILLVSLNILLLFVSTT